MSERYTALSLHVRTTFMPSQWEVGALPRPLYVRYRFGTLRVDIDEGDSLGETLLEMPFGDAFDSEMSTPVMQELTAKIIDWSACRW